MVFLKNHLERIGKDTVPPLFLHSMKRGEVTMAILADFSKAFDTVAYEIVLKKMHKVGFSKSYL